MYIWIEMNLKEGAKYFAHMKGLNTRCVVTIRVKQVSGSRSIPYHGSFLFL